MKTHELGNALQELSRVLKSGPDVEIQNLHDFLAREKHPSNDTLKIGLATLVDLSRVDKKKWLALIKEYNFPINTRPRDASRDLLGKLLRYLETHAEARETLKRGATQKTGQAFLS